MADNIDVSNNKRSVPPSAFRANVQYSGECEQNFAEQPIKSHSTKEPCAVILLFRKGMENVVYKNYFYAPTKILYASLSLSSSHIILYTIFFCIRFPYAISQNFEDILNFILSLCPCFQF